MQAHWKILVAALALSGASSGAAPAPWYWWISQHDGHRVCAQTMPSAGWRKGEGPFRNAQCRPERASLISTR